MWLLGVGPGPRPSLSAHQQNPFSPDIAVEYIWQNLDVTPRSPASHPILMRNFSLSYLQSKGMCDYQIPGFFF